MLQIMQKWREIIFRGGGSSTLLRWLTLRKNTSEGQNALWFSQKQWNERPYKTVNTVGLYPIWETICSVIAAALIGQLGLGLLTCKYYDYSKTCEVSADWGVPPPVRQEWEMKNKIFHCVHALIITKCSWASWNVVCSHIFLKIF